MHGSIRVLLALILLAGFGPSTALAQRHKLDDELQRLTATASGGGSVRVIVTSQPGRGRDAATRMTERGNRLRSRPAADVIVADVRRDDLAGLAMDPSIARVSIDAEVSPFGGPEAAPASDRGAGTRVRQERRSPRPEHFTTNVLRSTLGLTDVTYTGAGVGVAIIDSGIEPLADFDRRITAFRDFTRDDSPQGVAVAPYDDYGHGTHVAGLIGSNGSLSDGEFRGVAPLARLIGLKVLDDEGRGQTSDVIAALEFAIAHKASLGIDVVNLSLGHPIFEAAATDPLVQAVEKATRAGLIVMVAAGNYGQNPETGEVGYAGIMSPANAPSAITVGAVKTKGTVDRGDDRIADYSSRGPTWYDGFLKPDVVAPGDNIVSNVARSAWLAKTYPQFVSRNGSSLFMKLSGTSMSAGVATGVAALALEAQRAGAFARAGWSLESWLWRRSGSRMSANLVKALFQYSAIPVRAGAEEYDALTQGAGSINAEGVLRLAFALDTSAPLGTQWLGGFGAPSSTIGGEQLEWSETVYWGGREVLGPSIAVSELAWTGHVVWGTSTFWSAYEDLEHIVWGTMIDWSFADEHIVWGTGLPFEFSFLSDEHIVWGSNLYWDEHIVWGSTLIGLLYDEHIVWGTVSAQDTTYWGSLLDLEHIVWGTNTIAAAGLK